MRCGPAHTGPGPLRSAVRLQQRMCACTHVRAVQFFSVYVDYWTARDAAHFDCSIFLLSENVSVVATT